MHLPHLDLLQRRQIRRLPSPLVVPAAVGVLPRPGVVARAVAAGVLNHVGVVGVAAVVGAPAPMGVMLAAAHLDVSQGDMGAPVGPQPAALLGVEVSESGLVLQLSLVLIMLLVLLGLALAVRVLVGPSSVDLEVLASLNDIDLAIEVELVEHQLRMQHSNFNQRASVMFSLMVVRLR